MGEWTCSTCSESNESGFDACWNCGTHADGTAPSTAFVRDNAPLPSAADRVLSCLRCAGDMRVVGTRTYRDGSLASGTTVGALAGIAVDRDTFDVYACSGCGKAEFFLA